MMRSGSAGARWPSISHVADAVDVRSAYLVFLGRAVESWPAVRAKLGRPIDALPEDFLHAAEFVEDVATPVLSGRPTAPERFAGAPSAELRRWAATRLLGDCDLSAAARAARDWTTLWRVLLDHGSIIASLDTKLGAGTARALRDALALRRDGLSPTSAPAGDDETAGRVFPALSIVLGRPDAEAVLSACALVDPDLSLRAELLVVDERPGGAAWLDALRDAGRPIQHVIASPADMLGAALESARGDYLLLGDGPIAPEAAVACARELVVHDRPEALRAANVLALRTEACARVLRLDAPRRMLTLSELAARVSACGGRVEVMRSVAGGAQLPDG